jgi:hypothetical protein
VSGPRLRDITIAILVEIGLEWVDCKTRTPSVIKYLYW